MRFSILIPSYRRADLLALCLASVRRHAPPRAEILVVDDASAGGVISATAGRFAGVRVLRLGRRGGFCAHDQNAGAFVKSAVDCPILRSAVAPNIKDRKRIPGANLQIDLMRIV